jgi:DNA polymerase I-like protein with 3'-5' exonuclease and polymerase domains
MLLQVHDELVLEVLEAEPETAGLVQKVMSEAYETIHSAAHRSQKWYQLG